MRRTVQIAVVLALLISGLWAAAATGVRHGYSRVTEAGGAGGLTAMADSLSVRGFPLRVEADVSDPELADAAAGWAWQGDGLSLSAPLWQPTRLSLDAPERHSVMAGGETVALQNDRLEAHLHVTASTVPALRSARLSTEAFEAISDAGWQIALGAGHVSLEEAPTDADPHRYRLEVAGEGVAPPEAVLQWLDPDGNLPDRIDDLDLIAHLTFDRALDLDSLEQADLRPTRIEIEAMAVHWGEVGLTADGVLEVGPEGQPEGTISMRAEGWQRMVGLAIAIGLIDADTRPLIEGGLMPLAVADDDAGNLETDVTFRGGDIYVWPIPVPILSAPRL